MRRHSQAIYLGTRSLEQARLISAQLCKATIEVEDSVRAERARHAGDRAVLEAAFGGGDPVEAMLTANHHACIAATKIRMARDLRTPDEVLNTDMGRAYVFLPGVLERPFFAKVPRYWRRRDLAGRYLGDPFHSKPGTVEIATRWGQRHRKVITEDAPPTLRDWPQYKATGRWSYVKGFKPKVPRS